MKKKHEKLDLTVWNKGVEIMEKRVKAFAGTHPGKADDIFYAGYHRYISGVLKASEEGKLVYMNTSIPAEILYALDLYPATLTQIVSANQNIMEDRRAPLNAYEEYGMPTEACSAHRSIVGYFVKGWLPRPRVYLEFDGGVCDAFCHSARIGQELYGGPYHTIHKPYYRSEEGIKYLRDEYREAITFLEENTEAKMDWDKLREISGRAAEMVKLQREIMELRKAVPAPMSNVRPMQIFWFNWVYSGTETGIQFLTAVRDEVKEKVEKKEGVIPDEKYRYLDMSYPPFQYFNAIQSWLQYEKKAVSVMELFLNYWSEGELEYDPTTDPLEFLARRAYLQPMFSYQYHYEFYSANYVKAAKEYKADVAIRPLQFACGQNLQAKILADMIEKEVGIPVFTLEMDVRDPNYLTLDEYKEHYERFFEILDERKAYRSEERE